MNWKSKRGAALVMAIIFTLIMASLAVSYLNIAVNGLIVSDRSILYNSALNLGEAGVEEAAWSLNHKDWMEWSGTGIFKTRTFSQIDIGSNRTGNISVIVEDFSNDPTVFAEVSSQSVYGDDYYKQIEIKLTRRSLFANGLTAKDAISFVGSNVTIDSFNSDDGDYDIFFNRGANVTVASPSVGVNAVNVQNAKVFGYVATGGGDVGFGPNGYVSEVVDPPVHDPTRITKDFRAQFLNVSAPAFSLPNTSLPEGENKTIGTPGAFSPEEYKLTDLNISQNEKLVIAGPVTILVDNDVDVKGEIEVGEFGNVKIYVEGDFTVGGGSGTGVFFGAAVAYNITFNGTYVFHYDEALNNFIGDDPTFKIKSWRELVGSERINFDNYTQL